MRAVPSGRGTAAGGSERKAAPAAAERAATRTGEPATPAWWSDRVVQSVHVMDKGRAEAAIGREEGEACLEGRGVRCHVFRVHSEHSVIPINAAVQCKLLKEGSRPSGPATPVKLDGSKSSICTRLAA